MNIINNYMQLININKPIVFFDLETTGLNKINDRIIEIGAIKIINKKIADKLSILLDPGISIPYYSTKIHGITDDMVFNCPTDNEGVKSLLKLLNGCIIVAHNVSFDVGFINSYLERFGYNPLDNILVDTVKFARKMFPGFKKYALGNLANELNIDSGKAHRAFDDTFVCYQIYKKCYEKLINVEL